MFLLYHICTYVKYQFLTEMCLATIPSILYGSKTRPQPDTYTPYPSGTGSMIWQGLGLNLVRPEWSELHKNVMW